MDKANTSYSEPKRFSWREALLVYLQKPVIAMSLLGFSAGLPFLLVFSTLTAWLTEFGVQKATIGFFGWVGITYSIKVFWAPIVDQLKLPIFHHLFGKRRSWMLLGQSGVAFGLWLMAGTDPSSQLALIALCAIWVAFFSSTQDIAIDAFRIEAIEQRFQGAMSASYIFGYRVALLVSGAGALYIAEYASWSAAYQTMALLMLVGVLAVIWVSEPDNGVEEIKKERRSLSQWTSEAVVAPFTDFFQRQGHFALVILLFIAIFRLSDITMGIMANPFYLDLGFSKTEIANVGKVFGFFMTILGSFLGGLMVIRYGVYKPLLLGASLVALTNLLFAVLSEIGPDVRGLVVVISADNLSAGVSNAAFIAYLSGLTHRAYTATQYALFSSLMTLPGKFISGFSGLVVESSGYTWFFVYAAAVGVPAILMTWYLLKKGPKIGQETQ